MKKSIAVCIYVLLMVALLLVGCGRHAAPIVLPSVNDIDSISITTYFAMDYINHLMRG